MSSSVHIVIQTKSILTFGASEFWNITEYSKHSWIVKDLIDEKYGMDLQPVMWRNLIFYIFRRIQQKGNIKRQRRWDSNRPTVLRKFYNMKIEKVFNCLGSNEENKFYNLQNQIYKMQFTIQDWYTIYGKCIKGLVQ